MIISLHLPKTAGTSFVTSLEKHYGNGLLRDYSDIPINKPVEQRTREAIEACIQMPNKDLSGINCIHGHFLPIKYLLLSTLQPVTFITWMRHPVERVISHYYYWQKMNDLNTAAPLHRRVLEEGWSLERFCLSKELQNLYHAFLWGFPIYNVSFIGITEHYEEDLKYFQKHYIGSDLEVKRDNVGKNDGKKYDIDPLLRSHIEQYHREDMQLYFSILHNKEEYRKL